MRKRLLIAVMIAAMVVPIPALADEKADRIAALESQIAELQAELDELKAADEADSSLQTGNNNTDMEHIDIEFVEGNTILLGEDENHDNYLTIRKSILAFQFEELSEKVAEYAEGHPDDEKAAALLTILKEYSDISGLVGETDSFSGDYIIYYDGHKEITEDCHIVPYNESNSRCCLALGFVADDWLFAEDAIIKRDGESVNDGIWLKKDRNSYKSDVLGDGRGVYECIDEELYDSDAEYMASLEPGDSMALRFVGKDEKNLDFEVSDSDILAMKNIARFTMLLDAFTDLRY